MIKSKYDKRIYKTKILENKLEVMLIYDKDITRSSASMNIGVGCFDESEKISGLAHFVEHMIFMGTKKYPDDNEYFEYLNNNGGSSNAYTDGDVINYYFEINSIKLFDALDRFAQFFIEPLFKKESIKKEMNAVNAEHSKNIQNDSWRVERMLQVLAKKDHIINKFCTGTLETLNIKDIHKYVIELFNKYYSANIMKLVVLHNEPIDFENKYIQEFRKIKDLNITITKDISNPYDKNHIIIIKPILTYDILYLYWVIDSNNDEYFESLLLYTTYFFNNKDEKSLYNLLLNKKYIYTLNVGYDSYNNITHYLLRLGLSLTKKGIKNIGNIISIINSYIKYINTLSHKKLKILFEKFNTIHKLNFMFKEKEVPQDYVVSISNNMNKYKKKYYLIGNTLRKFDTEIIKKIFNKLKEKQTITIISSDDIYKKSNDKINLEKYYKIEYKIYNKEIKNIKKNLKKIKIQYVNKFIPKNLMIKKLDKKNKFPIQILKNDLYELWFKQDYKFKKPYIYLNIEILNPIVLSTSKNYVLTILFTNIINDFISKKMNDAFFVNYNCSVDDTYKGINIKIEGYNDKFYYFVKKIFKYIVNKKIYEKYYMKQYKLLKLQYKNLEFNTPFEQAIRYLKEILIENIISLEEEKKEIVNITINDLLEYSKNFFSNVYIKYIIQGNLRDKEVEKYINFIKNNKISYKPQVEIKKLDKKRYIFLTNSTNINDNDSSIISLYQIGKYSLKKDVLTKFLHLIINEPFFNELRTNQQMGYIVKNIIYKIENVINILFCIQSDVKDPNYLLNRIDIFLYEFRKKLNSLDLETYKVALKENFKEKYINLSEEFSYNVNEVYMEEYKFNRKELLYKLVEQIKKSDIMDFYDKYIINNGRNLVVQVCGKNCCSMTKLDKRFNKNV